MGELILPEGVEIPSEETGETGEHKPVTISEDWEVLGRIVAEAETDHPDDTPEERELRIDMAIARHTNQQKVMGYSRMNEVSPMTFVAPDDMMSLRMELILDRLCPTEEDRLAYELAFEEAVTEHIDAMGARIAQMRAQSMDPSNALAGPGGPMTRQQRRQRDRQMVKQMSKQR